MSASLDALVLFPVINQIEQIDTVLKKCVSPVALNFEVRTKNKLRTMELTTSQKSAFISEMLSSESGINELIRVLLNTFSKQKHALFLKEHEGEQCNSFRSHGSIEFIGL